MAVAAVAAVTPEYGMMLQNVTDTLDKRSKVVVTKERKLFEIRKGNNTFKKNDPLRHTWDTIADWTTWLQENRMPRQIECLDTPDIQKRLASISWWAAFQAGGAYQSVLKAEAAAAAPQPAAQPAPQPAPQPAGAILTSEDNTSKVLVLKNGQLLELRRGELTFTKETLKTTRPNIWKTVDEWRASLAQEPEPKRPRSNEFTPAEGVSHPIELARPLEPTGFPSHELKNRLVEQVKNQVTSQLKTDMNVFLDEWIQKFKIE